MMYLHTDLKESIANVLVLVGITLRTLRVRSTGLKLVLKGRRVGYVARADTTIRSIIERGYREKSEFHDFLDESLGNNIEVHKSRILILKLPVFLDAEVIEKGAIVIKFTEAFAPIYLGVNVCLLSRYFVFILEPSWAGYSLAEILVWTELNAEKVVVMTPDEDDFRFLSELKSNLIPVKLGAADWVNPEIFSKVSNTPKIYDAIYVANFNPGKRVDRYIRAIVRINRIKTDFRAALVCASNGISKREVMATLEWFSDKANISFFNGMAQSDLNKLLNQSKVNVLLSLKEGANKGLTEGLFSGTPALLLSENVGVRRANINNQTGKIIPDADLEDSLIWFADNYDDFEPHNWANEYISPTASTNNLEKLLQEIEIQAGRVWTRGLYPKVNEPDLGYLHPEDYWLLSKRGELITKFSHGQDEQDAITFLKSIQ